MISALALLLALAGGPPGEGWIKLYGRELTVPPGTTRLPAPASSQFALVIVGEDVALIREPNGYFVLSSAEDRVTIQVILYKRVSRRTDNVQ